MKKLIIIILSVFILTTNIYGQITKDNWMMGGNASYSVTHYNSYENGGQKNIFYSLLITPDVAYFFMDKLSAGLKLGIDCLGSKGTGTSVYSKLTNYNFGPFLRYYFLPKENDINVLVEGTYQYGLHGAGPDKETSSKNTFDIAAGPVMYFNSSVGMELLLNYSSYKFVRYSGSNRAFTISLGLQAYLKK